MVPGDLARPDTVLPAVEGADIVINLVGAWDGPLETLHRDGPAALAARAAQTGAAMIHVSANGVREDHAARYARTKAQGETAIRAALPSAIILAPTMLFGPDDQSTNRFAAMGWMPLVPVLRPDVKMQPLFVGDLARIVAAIAARPADHAGRRLVLGGPDAMRMEDFVGRVLRLSGRPRPLVPLPDIAGSLMAATSFLPGAPLSADQWALLQEDNVAPDNDAAAFGPLTDLSIAAEWLQRFRPGGRFRPVGA
jgi:NADH dehydrogenase